MNKTIRLEALGTCIATTLLRALPAAHAANPALRGQGLVRQALS